MPSTTLPNAMPIATAPITTSAITTAAITTAAITTAAITTAAITTAAITTAAIATAATTRRRSRRPSAAVTLAALASVVLTACITGERPTLVAPANEVVDDPAIAAVVERLDRADATNFTATYDIIPSLSGTPTEATVVTDGTRRRVRIGDIDFITDGGVTRTCAIGDVGCVDFLDDARVSDLNITNKFWGVAFASRLRLDGSRRVGFGEGSSETIAGQPALCVDVPVVSAAVTYCALEAGPLARYFGADVSIELTSFAVGADPADLEF